MRLSPALLSAFVVLSLTGCGAGAESGPGGGSGGGGGATPTTTTGTSGEGGAAGEGGQGAGTQTGTTGTGGAGVCDDAAFCGNMGNEGCVACAVNGPCGEVFAACFSNDDCSAYQSCLTLCGEDEACVTGCDQESPAGKELYVAYFQCVLCDECPVSCDSAKACGAL